MPFDISFLPSILAIKQKCLYCLSQVTVEHNVRDKKVSNLGPNRIIIYFIFLFSLSIVDFSRPIGHAELIPDHGIRWILLINEAVVYGFWRYATTGW